MPKRLQISDNNEYQDIKNFLATQLIPNILNNQERKKFKIKASKFILINKKLFVQQEGSQPLEFIPDFETDRKNAIIQEVHRRSHRGINTIFRELNSKFYNIKKGDVELVLNNCEVCSRRTVEITTRNITPIIILRKFDRFQIDITYMEQYSTTNDGFKYILNIIDCNSKFAWSYPCFTKSANEVYLHLESLFLNCFVPKELHSDNGTEFRNNKIASLCFEFKIRQVFGRPYHPETQGQIERFNFTLKKMLLSVMIVEKNTNWVGILKRTVYEYNIKFNRSINNTPVNEMLNYNGFNVEANLFNNNETPNFAALTLEEFEEINNYRHSYYLELSRNSRNRIVRGGLNLPRLN